MLGDTILDKLRLIYAKSEVSQEDRETSSVYLKELFPKAQTYSKAGYILNTLNPAKLVDSMRSIDNNHNLQIVSEIRLAQALREVFPEEMRYRIRPSIIHIAEDYILKNPVSDYITMLTNMDYAYLTGETIEADLSVSLYLAFNLAGEIVHFKIKFYDKGKEYCKRHDTPICKLYEPLTDREIELLGDSYNAETHSIDMSTVNMLRVEIELVQKDKLAPILKNLGNSTDTLTLPVILEALDKGTFYKALREVFREKLRKYVFTAEKTLDEVAKENKISTMGKYACKLQLEDSNSKYFTALMTELGYKEQVTTMNRLVRKVIPDSELYAELYSAIFPDDTTEESTEELVATTPDSTDVYSNEYCITIDTIASLDLYNSDLKVFILVYEVPIWDDS